MLTRTRLWLLAGVAGVVLGGWLVGLGLVPLVAFVFVAALLIVLSPRRVPVRDRALGEFDDGRDLTRFGWGHPMATSMLWGAAVFGWFNGTGGRDSAAGDGLGGAGGFDGGPGDFGGGDFGGGGGAE
jgi:hypothetical protein